ncbi:MAG TPA: transporter substrate-binding domain-containing protein, partial [Candidatus Ruania gallistercoris]|nr:transporter substrate-binding domain-containing protein [Candidatus Ruania gallistercoris]
MKNTKRFTTTAAVAATFLLAGGLTACGGGDGGDGGGEGGGLEDSYVVATDTAFVPFEFEEDGEYVGFDIDIINE